MADLLKLIWDICCLRRGPQDLPYAPMLLVLICAALLALEALIAMDAGTLAFGVAAIAINLTVLYALVFARGLPNRFVQTATALFACAIVFELMMMPLQLLFGDPKDAQASPLRGLLAIALLLMLSWKLIVDANIFRHALNVPFLTGILIAVTWFVIELYLLQAFAHVAPAA